MAKYGKQASTSVKLRDAQEEKRNASKWQKRQKSDQS